MSFAQEIKAELITRLRTGEEEEIVRFVMEKIFESYKNGIAVGKLPTAERRFQKKAGNFVKKYK